MMIQAIVTSDNPKDYLVGATKVLKALSNTDALSIFLMAKDGIEGEATTHSKIGLTRRRYYVRLMQLKSAGLIEKKGKLYFHTTMGSFLHENCINGITHAIRNKKKMAMIDVLKRQGNFAEEDLHQMQSAICRIPLSGAE